MQNHLLGILLNLLSRRRRPRSPQNLINSLTKKRRILRIRNEPRRDRDIKDTRIILIVETQVHRSLDISRRQRVILTSLASCGQIGGLSRPSRGRNEHFRFEDCAVCQCYGVAVDELDAAAVVDLELAFFVGGD